jgi:hypothetical protein
MPENDEAKPAPPAPQAPAPAPLRPDRYSAGAETLISEHIAAMSAAHPARRWFWINLLTLLALSAAATWWFSQQLQPFFTEVVLVGGSLTLWTLLRLVWAVAEKSSGFDAGERSRKLLSSPELTRLLIVAVVLLGLLWPTTASLYFEYGGPDATESGGGGGGGDYVVEVWRTGDNTRFIEPLTISSTSKVVGRPFFWQRAVVPLQCRIVKPAGFDARDCSLQGAHSVRLRVPGSFVAQELHLLRLVPSGHAFIELPLPADSAATRYQLELAVGAQRFTLDDIRKQTVYLGGLGERMDSALALELPPGDYAAFLARSFVAAQIDDASAAQMASVLSTRPRAWNVLQARAGQQLEIALRWFHGEGGAQQSGLMAGFPVRYTVTSDKVQTIWLPPL